MLQSTIGQEVITWCCLITVAPTRYVDSCLAVTVRSERKESRPYTVAMTICVQQATPYTCLRTCDCSTLYVEWSLTLQFGTQTHRNCLELVMHKHAATTCNLRIAKSSVQCLHLHSDPTTTARQVQTHLVRGTVIRQHNVITSRPMVDCSRNLPKN